MKMYWPTLPAKVSMSCCICSGVKTMNWQTTSHLVLPSLRVGLRSFMSPSMDLTFLGELLVAVAAVEDGDLVAGLHGELDAGQRDLAGAADEKDVECHDRRSFEKRQ